MFRLDKILSYWDVGEDAANDKLNKLIKFKLQNYSSGRDRPDTEFTSRLSPHLHFGEISPKRIYSEIMNSSIDEDNNHDFEARCEFGNILHRKQGDRCSHRNPGSDDSQMRSLVNGVDIFQWLR